MKAIQATVLFIGLSSAHSGVWKINIDGIEYINSQFIIIAILIFIIDTQPVTRGSMTN
jgi:hypothetical protein